MSEAILPPRPQSSDGSRGGERRVVFLLLPNVNLLDLAGPAQVFHMAAVLDLGMPYTFAFCAHQPEVYSAQGLALASLQPLLPVSSGDLVIVPGLDLPRQAALNPSVSLEPVLCEWLNDAYRAGARVASVCTGAFVLGEAGLLNGRYCTTHWSAVDLLRVRYPLARVQETALFVQDQRVTTSAGVASGIDMALSLLEQEYGPVLAAQVARYLVVYLRRNGFQQQNSVFLEYRTHLHQGIHQVQDYLVAHIAEAVSLNELAEVAQLSVRSLTRIFKEATGLTPVHYHQRLQLELAATFLENPDLSIETIASRCGFADARHFRRLWRQHFGMPPSTHRARGRTLSILKENRTSQTES